MNHTLANRIFKKVAQNIKSVFTKKWQGHRYETLKIISTTEKGNIGEDFLAELLGRCNYKNIEVVNGRRGHYDVAIKDSNNKNIIEFEVKVATEDVNSCFQFNGIRHDTNYTHLFCFGISPDDIGYLVVDKNNLNQESLVSMAKNSNSLFKLTKNKNGLSDFNNFCSDMKQITGGVI